MSEKIKYFTYFIGHPAIQYMRLCPMKLKMKNWADFSRKNNRQRSKISERFVKKAIKQDNHMRKSITLFVQLQRASTSKVEFYNGNNAKECKQTKEKF